jgi:ornithine carbamoyltransferase
MCGKAVGGSCGLPGSEGSVSGIAIGKSVSGIAIAKDVSAFRHFLALSDLGPGGLRRILDAAHARKSGRTGLPHGAPDSDAPLAGHVLASIFEKPSTRTRLSFDIAMRQLGGSAITLSALELQLGRGESIPDTARVMSGFVDVVAIRANRHSDVEAFAAAATVPVVNGLTDLSHPCQIVADLMAVEEAIGRPAAGTRWAWIGDGNNVCNSVVEAAGLLGFSLAVACPPAYCPNAEMVEAARALGADIRIGESPEEAAAGADVVVTDTWVSMGDTDGEQRQQAFARYQVNPELMSLAAPQAVFLHCLPAHRGEEVTDAVIDGPQSVVWAEAANRVHAQKAILLWALGKL